MLNAGDFQGYGAAQAPVCRTVYDNECTTVNEQQCSTVNEEQCSTQNRWEKRKVLTLNLEKQ